MADTWDGIVVRCNLNETGAVPRSASSNSPDLIISGTTPFPDPSILTDPNNYGNAYSNSLYIGLPNYLYVRGKNYTANPLTGSWNLFWATPNILLYPYLWEQNMLATSSGNQNPPFAIDSNKIGASEDCFTWVPPNVSDHYCLIGIANTPGHGNPLAGVNNITNLADTLANNGNIAQRNVNMVRGVVPQLVQTAGYSQGSEAAKVDLAVVFENIPKGSSYTIASGTPLNGKPLAHAESGTTDNNFKYAWTDLDIPAQWNTVFNWTLTFGSDWSGIPAGAHPTVTIRGELVQDEDDPLYHLGVVPDPHPVTRQLRTGARGGLVKVVVAGSVKTIAADMGAPGHR